MTLSLPQNGLANNSDSVGMSLQQLGIAILIDLAKQGEIDPWDVQVIDVIDRYLLQLAPMPDAGQLEREIALSQSGQAFLYASILVLLKADSLTREEEPPDDAEDSEIESAEELAARRGPVHLERQLRRRAVAQPPKKRRVSLQELIEQLQLMTAVMEQKPSRVRHRIKSPKSRAQTAQAIAHLAHHENLTEIAGLLERFFADRWHQISPEHDWLDLDDLLALFPPTTPQETAQSQTNPHSLEDGLRQNDRVGVFWALLLLSAQSKVELSQEEFYQDLKIRALV